MNWWKFPTVNYQNRCFYENMYKSEKLSGLNAYLSAMRGQDITGCNLYEKYNLSLVSNADYINKLMGDLLPVSRFIDNKDGIVNREDVNQILKFCAGIVAITEEDKIIV